MAPMLILGALAVNAALLVLWWSVSGRSTESTVDLRGQTNRPPVDLRAMVLRDSAHDRAIAPLLQRLGARIASMAPAGRLAGFERKLASAGASQAWTAERLLAIKVLAAIGLGLLSTMRLVAEPTARNTMLAVAAAVFGWFVPNAVLERVIERRRISIRLELSNTIDQLAVMVRAGLGIDAALHRTARATTGPLGQELTRVVQDMRVGTNRTSALKNLAERVDVPELRGFVGALAQAETLGVPVAHTLQLQADELRLKRRQIAEEQAMKLPVKILFPMVTCIMPVLFIVLLGPAVLRIMDTF